MINNYNEIYVTNQPTHSVFSIIIMDTGYPISEKSHKYIEHLQKFSDTCFLFSDKLYKSSNISKRKFTSLYEGNCWIDINNANILPGIIKVLDYSVEIFEKHGSFIITHLSDLEKYSDEDWKRFCENSNKVNMSNILYPILKIERLGNEKMYEFYKENEVKTEENSFIKFIEKKLFLNYFTDFFNKSGEVDDDSWMYASWKTESIALFFRLPTIKLFIEFLENNPNFINTFRGDRTDLFFSSLIRRLGIKNHNCNIEELDLGEKV